MKKVGRIIFIFLCGLFITHAGDSGEKELLCGIWQVSQVTYKDKNTNETLENPFSELDQAYIFSNDSRFEMIDNFHMSLEAMAENSIQEFSQIFNYYLATNTIDTETLFYTCDQNKIAISPQEKTEDENKMNFEIVQMSTDGQELTLKEEFNNGVQTLVIETTLRKLTSPIGPEKKTDKKLLGKWTLISYKTTLQSSEPQELMPETITESSTIFDFTEDAKLQIKSNHEAFKDRFSSMFPLELNNDAEIKFDLHMSAPKEGILWLGQYGDSLQYHFADDSSLHIETEIRESEDPLESEAITTHNLVLRKIN